MQYSGEADLPQESAILDRRSYNKGMSQSSDVKINDVLFKVNELKKKLQRFDAISLDQLNQMRCMVDRLFDRPNPQPSPNEIIAHNVIDRSRTSSPASRSQIASRSPSVDRGAVEATPPPTATLAETHKSPIVIASILSGGENICPVRSLAMNNHTEALKTIGIHSKSPYSRQSIRPRERELFPDRSTARHTTAADTNIKSSSNVRAVFAWILTLVIVSLIAFVADEATGLATINTIAELCGKYVEKFQILMKQSLVIEGRQSYPNDSYHTQCAVVRPSGIHLNWFILCYSPPWPMGLNKFSIFLSF